QHMVGDHFAQQIEPEQRKLREHAALVGNRRGHHHVKRGKAVRRYNQQPVPQIIDVPNLASCCRGDTGKTGFANNFHCGACAHGSGSLRKCPAFYPSAPGSQCSTSRGQKKSTGAFLSRTSLFLIDVKNKKRVEMNSTPLHLLNLGFAATQPLLLAVSVLEARRLPNAR